MICLSDFCYFLKLLDENEVQIIEKPSKIKSKFWLHAEIKKGIYKPYSEKSGKWLLFIPREQIDQTWAVIKKYTEVNIDNKSTKLEL